MQKQEAIKSAKFNAFHYGLCWHVVKLNGEYYEVSEHWFKQHPGNKSLGHWGEPTIEVKRKYVWYRMPIVWFNKLLIWIFRKWLIRKR